MRTVSVRELQQNIRNVLRRVERGETIEVTRRRRPVARLTPVPTRGEPLPWSQVEARVREIFGDRVISPSISEQLIADRGDR